MAARTLMMVVKAIQNLANHVEFVANYKVNLSDYGFCNFTPTS